MDIIFKDSEGFTLGVELEMQLVDSETFSLVDTSTKIIDTLAGLDDSVKHELLRSNLEIVSGVCADVREVEADLRKKLGAVVRAAAEHGTLLVSAGTHPFSGWREQKITESPRYLRLYENLQMVARRFNIFGFHVHVGVKGGERCIYIMNKLLYYLPHLLALSANSPFWEGIDTGLRSYRTKVFETLPVAGLPFYFHDWSDYEALVTSYVETGTIETIRELWWDVRPHPDFGTIELRICDNQTTLADTMSIVALVQALVKKFSDEFDTGAEFERPHSSITRENKWRACRYGLEGSLIGSDGLSTIDTALAVCSLAESLEDIAAEFGSLEYLGGIENILTHGTGAARQLEVFKETGSLTEVVKYLHRSLAAELEAGDAASGEGR